MPRPSLLPRALARVTAATLCPLVLAAIAGVGTPAPATAATTATTVAAPQDTGEPLELRMSSITPDYIPDHGPIVVRGRITNRDTQEWTAINVHAFLGSTPITTTAGLAAAAQTPVADDVGHRITRAGTFDHIDSLQPGESTTFEVTLPRSTLAVSTPGVYWFGVHALGSTAEGSSPNAVGRDRTFIPLIPSSAQSAGASVDTAIVLPVRAPVTRASDGSIQDPATWQRSLSSGSLHSVVRFGRAAQGSPITWLLDPAVPDAVRQLARGNPARTLLSPGGGGATPSTGSSPSADPSPSSSGSASGTSFGALLTATNTRHTARLWLRRLHQALGTPGTQILGLPYGDLAVDSAVRYDRPLLRAAIRRTGTSLSRWHLPLTSVVAPPGGRMTGSDVSALPSQTRVLLPDTGVTGSARTVNAVDGRTLVLTSSGAASGGPGPVSALSAIALRQRILCEAALRLLGDGSPLVVELPTGWNHLAGRGFFSGLDVPWLRLTTLDDATAGARNPLPLDRLRAPSASAPAPDPEIYGVANRVVANARALQSVLVGNHTLARQVFDQTVSDTSYAAGEDPYGALARVQSTDRFLAANLAAIHLVAPPSVTLASAHGRFSAQISNDLDVPVRIRVRALADPHLLISGGETLQLPPHGRTTILLGATTHVLGVHTVTLQLTNAAGTPLGSSEAFPIRAEQVSRLIWVIIGAGLALLFAAILVRLGRRLMRARVGSAARTSTP